MPELPGITAQFRAQRGLVTREQAIAAGLSAGAVDHRIRSGRWEVVHPAVYRLAGVPRSWHQDALAGTLWMARSGLAAISHLAALYLWGRGAGLRRPVLEVTVRHDTRPRCGRLRVHRTNHLPSAHVEQRLGIAVTSVERTLLDCAARVSAGRLELAVENAIRLRLTTMGELDAIVHEMSGRRHPRVGVLREIVDARRAGGEAAADGDLELAAWKLIAASGLPLPRRQHVVEVDGGAGRCPR